MRYTLFFFCLLAASQSRGQNLVPNPSFELYSECPVQITQDRLIGLDYWYQPTKGSADYYNRCAKHACGVPRNTLGFMNPRTGNGYVGIICYLREKGKNEYREYLETQLTEGLQKGHRYCVQLHIALAGSSLYATTNMDVLLSRFVVKSDDDRCIDQVPQLHFTDSLPMSNERAWKEISWVYTAEGGERFMTIGNFESNKETNYKRLPKEKVAYDPARPETLQYPEAYYYLDDVCVVDITGKENCTWDFGPVVVAKDSIPPIAAPKETYVLNKKLVLKNIYFDTDRAQLLPASDTELDKLYTFLAGDPGLKATITGHTDNQGTETHNRLLSMARAKAVMEYLVSRGIDERRLSYAGAGQSQPIASNETESGRQMNRRVELMLAR